ncbi:MAG: hypothetical protein A2X61_01630 [Ignavibacteria bacterium GWB2_35_12]|nr:MAG: hypothetical protein A2X63_05220 [Ignavibacteria bacterium GWA2_35_8]OGU41871.1 MAG: hypothetical protein A2X61_01630 [Ignavibacteria bacterium GWB2_35_12]OGU86164.1 MAG: hypothetical protein A2220_17360 [Ignavibacteria bacterium RIFOXYA2_FULL_35_10]OGV23481.1 MAG: hypothetical protein A2475_06015 [Ignavibacteria bacterium RIFOXYC2_FULL_35_21]
MNLLKKLPRFFLPVLFLLFIFVLACTKDNNTNPNDSNMIAGVIKDEQDNGVPNALIEAINNGTAIQSLLASDTTDEDGKFALNGMPDDISKVDLKITHEDFKSVQAKASNFIGNHDRKDVPIKLLHEDSCCGQVTINTFKHSDSSALSGVEVRLSRGDKLIRKAHTNEQGILVFEHVCEGHYWLRLAKEGYKVIEKPFELNDCDTLGLSFYLLSNDEHDSCCNGVINLTVLDSATQLPLPQATVRLWKGEHKLGEYKTNEDGIVIFRGICEGDYQLSIFKYRYYGQEFNFHMDCDDTVDFSRYLKPTDDSCCHGILRVFPKDKSNDQPLNGATVKLWKDGQLIMEKKVENGVAEFPELCEGAYGVDILFEGYQHIEFSIELTCNETKEVTKYMQSKASLDSCCKGVIEVVALDSAMNTPLPGVTVRLWKGNQKLAEYKTNEQGLVVFREICEGEYGISLTKEGWLAQEFSFQMNCNDTVRFEKKMVPHTEPCQSQIKIYVKDKKNEQPLNGATVKMWKGDDFKGHKTVENGFVLFTELCAGKYSFDITKDGYRHQEFAVEIGGNEVKEFTKLMESDHDSCCNGTIYFNAKDSATGLPIKNVVVSLWKGNQKLSLYKTDEEGNVVFKFICEGEYGISYSHEIYKGSEFSFQMGCDDTVYFHKLLVMKDTCCRGIIKVYPKDKDNNEPLNGATVKLFHNGTLLYQKSVQEGLAKFVELCEGTYHLTISKDHYEGDEFDVTMTCNQVIEETRLLQRLQQDSCCQGQFHVFPKDKDTQEPLNGAKVKLWKNGQLIATKTVENGVAKFVELCEGEYGFSIHKEGYGAIEFEEHLGCNETKPIYKELQKNSNDTCCTAVLKLKVIDNETEQPIHGATVKVYLGDDIVKEGTTNEEGWVIFEGLCHPSTYVVKIIKEGYQHKIIDGIYFPECNMKIETVRLTHE